MKISLKTQYWNSQNWQNQVKDDQFIILLLTLFLIINHYQPGLYTMTITLAIILSILATLKLLSWNKWNQQTPQYTIQNIEDNNKYNKKTKEA